MSFESVLWNAYVHRLDLGLYSHPKEFIGNGGRTRVNSKPKIPFAGVTGSPMGLICPVSIYCDWVIQKV